MKEWIELIWLSTGPSIGLVNLQVVGLGVAQIVQWLDYQRIVALFAATTIEFSLVDNVQLSSRFHAGIFLVGTRFFFPSGGIFCGMRT